MSPDLIDQLSVAIIVVDEHARILSLNNSAQDFMMTTAHHAHQQTLDRLIGYHTPWQTLLQHTHDENRAIMARNIILNMINLKKRYRADLSIRILEQPNHDNQYLIELHPFARAHNIMHTQSLQNQAEQTQHFLRNLAHEIRNPLAGIKGAAQRVKTLCGENAHRYIDIIINQTDRLNTLLKSMYGTHKIQKSPENIHRILEETVTLFSSAEENRHIIIKRQYDPSIPDIHLDAHLIQQALLNLLSNAAKATDYQGVITLTSKIRHQYTIGHIQHRQVISLSIHDNGCGIPETLHSAIFQPMISHFQQGSGLGLSIVHNIIHQHQGAIELDSEPHNTTFTLILPYQNEHEPHLDY